MFDFSIVQSNTHCLLQPASGIDSQLLFSQFLEKQSEEAVLSGVEVDTDKNGIYRVWRDSQFLGTFHRDQKNGLWISETCNYKLAPRFETSNDAVMFIIVMNSLAAA